MGSRGLGNSPLGAGITAGQRRLGLQRGEDAINVAESAVEADIASAKEAVRQANDAEFRSDLNSVAGAGVALVDNVVSQNSPLRKKLGFPDIVDPQEEFLKAWRAKMLGESNGDANVQQSMGNPTQPIQDYNYAPILAPMGRDIPSVHLNAYLNKKGIAPSSKYGRAYRSNFRSMQQLEDALGSDFLDNIFKWE